jgi:hypothetical protein
VTHLHDDDAPVEHDPTGMRALLASLPAPEPMPVDLVARISAALADEVGPGDGIEQLWHLSDDGTDAVPPTGQAQDGQADSPARVLTFPRRVRRRHLGVAAAVVGVLGLGGYVMGSVDGGVMAALTAGSSDSAADSGAASEAAGSADTRGKAQALVAPAAGSGDVAVVMSGVDHSSDRLEVTASALDDGTLDPIAELSAESPSLGPIATPLGARACADALGIPADAGILVDVSEVDGASAAVLVVHSAAGHQAWAVDRSCTTGATGLIRGPVALP